MPDQNPKLRAEITTSFDGKGTEDAKKAIGEVQKTAAQEAKSTTEATEKVTSSKGRLRNAIRGAALEFPFLGRVAQAALNPLSALFGGIALGVGKLSEMLRGVSDAFAGVDERSKEVAKTFAEQQARLTDAATAGAEFERQLKAISTAQEDTKAKTDAAIQSIRDEIKAMQDLADADKELALARINLKEKTGELDPSQAAAARAKIEQDAAATRKQLTDEERARVLKTREEELIQVRENRQQLEEDSKRKRAGLPPEDAEEKIAKTVASRAGQIAALEDKLNRMIASGAFTDEGIGQQRAFIELRRKQFPGEEAALQEEINRIKAQRADSARTDKELEQTRQREAQLEVDLPRQREAAARQGRVGQQVFERETEARKLGVSTATPQDLDTAKGLVAEGRQKALTSFESDLKAIARVIAETPLRETREVMDMVIVALRGIVDTQSSEFRSLRVELEKQVQTIEALNRMNMQLGLQRDTR